MACLDHSTRLPVLSRPSAWVFESLLLALFVNARQRSSLSILLVVCNHVGHKLSKILNESKEWLKFLSVLIGGRGGGSFLVLPVSFQDLVLSHLYLRHSHCRELFLAWFGISCRWTWDRRLVLGLTLALVRRHAHHHLIPRKQIFFDLGFTYVSYFV